MPLISEDEEIPAYSAGLSISMATGGLGLSVLMWAALSDRFGRVTMMKVSAIAAAVFGILTPIMPTWDLLLLTRILEGMALGALPALAIAYLGEEIHPRFLAISAGAYVSGNTIGGLSGRVISGIVGDWFVWRIGVLAVGVTCALAAIAFVVSIPQSRGFMSTVERARRGAPVIPLLGRMADALRRPRLWAVYGIGFGAMGAFVALYSYVGYVLVAPPISLPTSITSLIFLVYLVGTVGSRVAGKVAFRLGSRVTILLGAVMMVTGSLLTIFSNLAAMLTGIILFTYGFFTVNPVAQALTTRLATSGRAQAGAFYQLFYYAGSAFLGWFVGVLMVGFGWPAAAASIALTCAFVGVIAGVWLRRLPQSEATGQMPILHHH